ncbi:tetratricopeptide repeat protein [Pseudodesulfovibrio sp.]|uniref:tetratricopeptide repeat protein n=1 Tax=unclassified Pseudodesulfovibrio TaxID=2661612 RepID=UPI003AFF7435
MRHVGLAAAFGLLLTIAGCVVPLKSGSYYLEKRQYTEGVEAQHEWLLEHPDDADARYYIGRYYLAMEQPAKAMDWFDKAIVMDPDNADYVFWKGVTYWALMEYGKERLCYEKAIKLDPGHISAHLYLGHGYTDDKDWARALAQYDTVLKLDPYNPEALYNRAIALGGLGRKKEEVAQFRAFLKDYPDGSLAMQAAERLNLLGDFSYRNFIIGRRNVTLKSMAFKKWSSELTLDSKESLHVIEAMMKTNKTLVLNIVAYKKGDLKAARAMALEVRHYILSGRRVEASRLPVSWFDSSEIVEMGGKRFALDDSVQFITAVR